MTSPGPPPLWTATDARAHVTRLLGIPADGSPLSEFLPRIPEDAPARALRHRAALAITLIAGLELARDGTLGLEPAADWTPIHVTRGETGDAVADDPSQRLDRRRRHDRFRRQFRQFRQQDVMRLAACGVTCRSGAAICGMAP
jgi:hypothetical protein